MKVKHILAVLILGTTCLLAGSLFKILHLAGASILMMSGVILEVISGILIAWKLISTKDFKDFMNK